MTDYVIWTRGLRGPAISVLRGSSVLSERDRKIILSGPTKIAPEHESLSLSDLAKIYPSPRPYNRGPLDLGDTPDSPDDDPPPSGAPAAAMVAA